MGMCEPSECRHTDSENAVSHSVHKTNPRTSFLTLFFFPFCRATLKDNREVCLDPTAPWVQRIVKAILAK